MAIKKTMQPTDVDLTKLRYPCLISPKIDGAKLVRFDGQLKGRSFKHYRNKHLNAMFDKPEYEGFEGEVIVGKNPYAHDLCRMTTSCVNSFEGEPAYTWYVFDYVTDKTLDLTYLQRLDVLIHLIKSKGLKNVVAVPVIDVSNEDELVSLEQQYLDLGAEGIIIRDPYSLYKQGRTTVNSQEVLRLKRFSDSEAVIIGFTEQMYNGNEATIDELGRTSRSSHQENLIGKDTLGSLIVRDCVSGVEFSIGSGFDDTLRLTIWNNQEHYIGKIVKYKFFDKGMKDNTPRFPTFLSFRSLIDMEN